MTQREAFEAWARVSHVNRNVFTDDQDLTIALPMSWSAWQAAQAQAAERCKYCDNTGDVHSPTGEWRGVCTECKQVARQEPVANVTISNWRGQGENIEWQMQAELPEGTHLLFTSPPPDHRDAPQAAYDTGDVYENAVSTLAAIREAVK